MRINCLFIPLSLSFFIISSLISCGSKNKPNSNNNPISSLFESKKFDADLLTNQLKDEFKKNSMTLNRDTISEFNTMKAMYAANNNNSFWLSGNGWNEEAKTLLEAIDSLSLDGIDKDNFNISALEKLEKNFSSSSDISAQKLALELELATSLVAIRSGNAMLHGLYKDSTVKEHFNTKDTLDLGKMIVRLKSEDSLKFIFDLLRPNIREYAVLQNKLKELQRIRTNGGWEIINKQKDTTNSNSNKKIISLRKRLFKEIGAPTDTITESSTTDLEAAISKFQYIHDIKITGKIDTFTSNRLALSVNDKIKNIQLNMDRIRWLQRDIPQPYIWVNIPQMELQYLNNDSLEYQMRVVVGRVSRPTPTLDASMSNIVFNPPWSVPETIMKEEIIPGMKRKGASYLTRRGLKAFLGGREVRNLAAITEANFKRYSIQQKPGLNSSLGAVKFNLPNKHAIYLHDTPHREDFAKFYRAYSSGCIRVHHPREFAEFLLKDSNYTKAKIDSLVRNKTTKERPLAKKIPVHIVYITNGLDSLGNFKYLRDIYSYDLALQKSVK
jgi:L,D-transpeptidase YcbB